MRVTQSSKSYGNSTSWYRDFDRGEESIDVQCKLNSDGTVTVKTSGSIPIYTEYSSISEGLEKDSVYVSVNRKMSSMGTIRVNSYTTLTISTSGISINYNKVSPNEDIYFTYTYKTTMSLNKKSKSY